MRLDKYYLHGINANEPFEMEETLYILQQLLETGYILSRRKRGDTDPTKGGFSGFDHLSLCDYSLKDAPPFENKKHYIGYTGYECYIKLSLSLILSKNKFKVVKPELIAPCVFGWDAMQEMRYLGNHSTSRFSDLPDEVQAKHRISMKHLRGITIPISHILSEPKEQYGSKKQDPVIYTRDMVIYFWKEINALLRFYGQQQKIYDLETVVHLKDVSDIDRVIEKRIK